MICVKNEMAQAFAQRRARTLLAAWNSGDLARLEAALDDNQDAASGNFADAQWPAIEKERMELIGEVVAAIRGWIARVRTEAELQAALLLLRHVGCQEPVHFMKQRTQEMALTGSRSI